MWERQEKEVAEGMGNTETLSDPKTSGDQPIPVPLHGGQPGVEEDDDDEEYGTYTGKGARGWESKRDRTDRNPAWCATERSNTSR